LQEFEQHLGDFDRVLTPDLDRQLSAGLRYALRLIPGVLAEAHLAILGWDGLNALEEPLQRRILAALREQIVLLVSRDPTPPAPAFASNVLALGSDGIRGIGDTAWYDRLDRKTLLERPSRDPEEEWNRSSDPDDLDDEADEDD
jgi:hypothetical protein